ncbi:unnamed protein product [Soboliphyme baturini]|uniref:MFS domain-containing protein n=1 Tax=Soboliphyme baturini TaxID=241478 RepID=A0A183IE23_9BILA|nr:unnamed protein product [Soboliphyme baturini]
MSLCTEMSKLNFRLLSVLLAVGIGTNLQLYSSSIFNNLVNVSLHWLNNSHQQQYSLLPDENDLRLRLSAAVSSFHYGAIVGALFTAVMADTFDRKVTLIIAAATTSLGLIMSAFGIHVYQYGLLVAGRIVSGTAVSCGLGVSSIFLYEIAPCDQRFLFAVVQQGFIGIGSCHSLAAFRLYLETKPCGRVPWLYW